MKRNGLVNVLQKRIEDNINVYFPALTGKEIEVRGTPWGGVGTACTFRFKVKSKCNNQKYIVFAKVSPIFGNNNIGKLEYEALKFVYPGISSENSFYHVPRPLDFYRDYNALLIEGVNGICFRNLLLKFNSKLAGKDSLDYLESTMFKCGGWLQMFHSITKKGDRATFDLQSFVSSFIEEIQLLEKFGFHKKTIEKIWKIFECLKGIDKKIEMPVAMWHYDFTPGHVFISDDKVYVIDILGKEAPIYEDIGHWLASIAVVNAFPRYPFFDYERVNTILGNRFLNGYYLQSNIQESVYFILSNIYKLKYLIEMFSEQHARVSQYTYSFVANLFSRFRLVRLFQRHILQTIDVISERLDLLQKALNIPARWV
jgi:hypothetical protein